MARSTVGPRRADSQRTYLRGTRLTAGLTALVLSGAIVWDLANDGFWSRHTLLTDLVGSLIVVAVTVALLNDVLERRRRQRWSVLAQYALFEFVRTARLVWSGLLELAGLVPDGELGDEALAAGSEAVRETPRLAAAIDDRHVELYSRLYWWGSVLDESVPLEEHHHRPRLSRVSPATQTYGSVDDAWLRENLVAITQLAESLDRSSFQIAFRIVSRDWWRAQLPDRPRTAENLPA